MGYAFERDDSHCERREVGERGIRDWAARGEERSTMRVFKREHGRDMSGA